MESNQNFVKYGSRTSSLITLYPHFKTYQSNKLEGEIRYQEKRNVVGIANEPLSPKENKKDYVLDFFSDEKFKQKSKLVFPITESLAFELKASGFNVWQIGVEPIFNLRDYFSSSIDPLYNFPISKSLKRRGGMVFELSELDIEKVRNQLEEIKEEWLSQKKLDPIEFLNVVSPFEKDEFKRFFVLKDRNQITAFLTASPIYLNQQIIGYFFNDIIRRKRVRSGTNELLIIESMRSLYNEGVLEVRLGLCPLAKINPDEKDAQFLTNIYNKWKIGYNFKSLFDFKNKLQPTKFRPLYLASDKNNISKILWDVVKLHATEHFFKNFIFRTWYEYKQNLKLKDHVKKFLKPSTTSGIETLKRLKYTLTFFTFFVCLHFLKDNSIIGKKWFDTSAYIPGQVTIEGLFIAPLFHNHAFHLIGDQLSFLVFAGALEFVFGPIIMLSVTFIGLWLSNPLTHALLGTTLKFLSPTWWDKVLLEKDYGTSNAVFALVGTSIYVLKKNIWLFIPFLFHALFVCFQRESFLAIHHMVGIFMGYTFGAMYFRKKLLSQA